MAITMVQQSGVKELPSFERCALTALLRLYNGIERGVASWSARTNLHILVLKTTVMINREPFQRHDHQQVSNSDPFFSHRRIISFFGYRTGMQR